MFEPVDIPSFKEALLGKWIPEVERCGVISPSGEIRDCANLADDPRDQFRFSLADLEAVGATWHTHPASSSNLSIADYWFFMQWKEMLHFVVSVDHVQCYAVTDGTVRILDEAQDYSAWLLERPLPCGD